MSARRKFAYYATIGKTWDCGLLAYAAGRDTACSHLDRRKAEDEVLLEGIEFCIADYKAGFAWHDYGPRKVMSRLRPRAQDDILMFVSLFRRLFVEGSHLINSFHSGLVVRLKVECRFRLT